LPNFSIDGWAPGRKVIRAFFTDGVIEGAKNPENKRDELAPARVKII
jgi:hypothetical protein